MTRPYGGHLFRGAGKERGQTTTEYLMIVGLITAVFVVLSGVTQRPFQAMMQDLLQCIADGTTNQLACERETTIAVRVTAGVPPVPPDVGALQQMMGGLQQIFNTTTTILNTILEGMQQSLVNIRGAVARPESGRHT